MPFDLMNSYESSRYPQEQDYDIQPRKGLKGKEWKRRKKARKRSYQSRRRNQR